MKILIFEKNLLWSSRIKQNLKDTGIEYEILTKPPSVIPRADVAIVNLGTEEYSIEELIKKLKDSCIYVIGHAGHKETPLLEKGDHAGCNKVISNSMLTYKLMDILAQIPPHRVTTYNNKK